MATSILRSSSKIDIGGKEGCYGYPLFLGQDGRVVEELAMYFRERYSIKNANLGSLMNEAYILREWWDFLVEQRILISEVTERMFLLWMRGNELRVEKARAQRKIDLIYRFQRFVLKRTYGPTFPLGIFESQVARFRYPLSELHSKNSRPTPDDGDVEIILNYLANQSNDFLSVRDYLVAKWMAQTGLRVQGAAQLSVSKLIEALAMEKIQISDPGGLSSLGPQAQNQLLDALQDLRFAGRDFLYVEVTEKRSKSRKVQAPIDLVIETLEYIWGERRAFLRRKHTNNAHSKDSGSLWISAKTMNQITRGAIGDIVKKAFHETGIKGSAHRLRAYYACSLVLRLYRQAKELHGDGWNAPAVLLEAAELLGHNKIESLRPYLNRAIRENAFNPN